MKNSFTNQLKIKFCVKLNILQKYELFITKVTDKINKKIMKI